MKVLATYSIKGGVGKTAAATNLAWLAARDGGPTLIWDLDPQGAATFNYHVRPRVKGGAKGLVREERPLEKAIKGTEYPGLDLLPADFRYRNLDLQLDQAKKSTRRLARLLKQLKGDYEWVILDCPRASRSPPRPSSPQPMLRWCPWFRRRCRLGRSTS
jgi:chromosome partitioning protein